jgi:hypothetical protein
MCSHERYTHPTIHDMHISGTAFVILNKAKGWWVVQRDPRGTGDVTVDDNQSGWVPAGKSNRDALVAQLCMIVFVSTSRMLVGDVTAYWTA